MGKTRQEVTFPGVDVRDSSIRLQFTTEDGKRQKKTFKVAGRVMPPTDANVKAAMKLVAGIKHEIKIGSFSMERHFPDDEEVVKVAAAKPDVRTVGEQLKHYLSIAKVEPSTKNGYESAAKFWRNAQRAEDEDVTVGETPITEILYSHLQYAITSKADDDGTSGKTLNNYLSVLRKAMQVAVSDKMLDSNPAANTDLRSDYQPEDPDPFELEEARLIIAYAKEHYPEQIYNQIDFWFHAGLRTSEMAGLLWKDTGLRKGTVTVKRVNVRGEERESTKTKRVRTIPLNSIALAAMKRQKAHTYLAGKHVWLDPRYGTPWDEERAFRRSYWTPALKALGIRYRRPYNARHTFATMLLMSGFNHALAAKRMGHSVQMFQTKYTKWLDDGHEKVHDNRLEAFITGPWFSKEDDDDEDEELATGS